MVEDYVAFYINPDVLRDLTVIMCLVAAVFIGGNLAFAATPDASFRCFQAFIRMIHRFILIGLSLALLNNAAVISVGFDGVGSTFLVFVFMFASVVVSAMRYKFWMGDIPMDASWSHPHFTFRKSNAQSAIDKTERRLRKAG